MSLDLLNFNFNDYFINSKNILLVINFIVNNMLNYNKVIVAN